MGPKRVSTGSLLGFLITNGSRSRPVRYAAVGGPNQVVAEYGKFETED
jgi:hypothetical protein